MVPPWSLWLPLPAPFPAIHKWIPGWGRRCLASGTRSEGGLRWSHLGCSNRITAWITEGRDLSFNCAKRQIAHRQSCPLGRTTRKWIPRERAERERGVGEERCCILCAEQVLSLLKTILLPELFPLISRGTFDVPLFLVFIGSIKITQGKAQEAVLRGKSNSLFTDSSSSRP